MVRVRWKRLSFYSIAVFVALLTVSKLFYKQFYPEREVIVENRKVSQIKTENVVFQNTSLNFVDIDDGQRQCSSSFAMDHQAHSDIDMLEIYKHLDFGDKREFGDWQQHWKINIEDSRFGVNEKLNVFLLPHSHNDPGWLNTFEEYYEKSVRNILTLTLENLSRNPELKFIWAEISYFDLWWNEISNKDKVRFKRLIERGQIEFVTGGWVMPDEANSHYYSLLVQLFEGNQWLYQHLQYVPKNGWSIDPFGLSPTMAYILKRSGFTNMLIQRTHYLVKKYLGRRQQLEFIWRQNWDQFGSTDMMTHLMPFQSYITGSTCGPDQILCRTFDYREPESPWFRGVETTSGNIDKRSSLLVEQYKKKAMLFQTNNILVPLGMDFAWVNQREWNDMTRNYGNISKHVNNFRKDLKTQMKYGTLDDYFQALQTDLRGKSTHLPKLSGDFFTYADKNQHYWSGYYTSRPFHKALDRKLISTLRAAHIAYSFLNGELVKISNDLSKFPFMEILFGYLRHGRRSLSLFQHHDGVTGTSKDYVMMDYARKLTSALANCSYVIEKSLQILTHIKVHGLTAKLQKQKEIADEIFQLNLQSVNEKVPIYTLPSLETVNLTFTNPVAAVTVFNSLAQTRTTLITLKIQIPNEDSNMENCVQVTNLKEEVLESELFPVFQDDQFISTDTFHLHFVATMKSMAVNTFILTVNKCAGTSQREDKVEVILSDDKYNSTINNDNNKFQMSQNYLPINISNGFLDAHFDSNGFLTHLFMDGSKCNLKIGIFTYGTKLSHGAYSGLYLFLPNGPAEELKIKGEPSLKVVKGKLQSYVEISLPLITHRITLYNHSGLDRYAVEITNRIDVRTERNFELMMRFDSDIHSGNISFTDLNAFQMIERKRFDSLPLQGHHYPMPSASYIEDSNMRMTVLGGQPVGTASLHSGQIDVIMDRTLTHDDGLGVGQGSGEALKNMNVFKLLLQRLNCVDEEMEVKSPMLSLVAHHMKNQLLNPLQIFRAIPTDGSISKNFSPLISDYERSGNIACDIEFVDAIPLTGYKDSLDDQSYFPLSQFALFIHRVGFDDRFNTDILQCPTPKTQYGKIRLEELYGGLLQENVTQKSLTFLHDLTDVKSNENLILEPMEMYAFHVEVK